MAVELPCLTSFDAFLAAGPDEVAAAVLWVGLKSSLGEQPGREFVDVPVMVNTIARAMGLTDAKGGSMAWMRWVREHPNAEFPLVVNEGIIFAEQRLCLHRRWGSQGDESVRLLRRGRDAIASGDPFKYLRTG